MDTAKISRLTAFSCLADKVKNSQRCGQSVANGNIQNIRLLVVKIDVSVVFTY